MDYFTTFTTAFGPLAWTFFVIQILLAAAGVYLGFVRSDAHPVRGPALKRLGYALLALGGIGVVLGALRLAAVPPFTARYWFYLVAVFEVALAFFVAFYSRTTYQEQMAAASRASRQPGARSARGAAASSRAAAPNRQRAAVETRRDDAGMPVVAAPPASVSRRREARRDRKRRKR